MYGVSEETALFGALLRLSVASRIAGVRCRIKCNYEIQLLAFQQWLWAPDAPWCELRQVACLDHGWLQLERCYSCPFAKDRVLGWERKQNVKAIFRRINDHLPVSEKLRMMTSDIGDRWPETSALSHVMKTRPLGISDTRVCFWFCFG